MAVFEKKYTFSYESSIDEKGFLLGADFPFYKEEFLKINFQGERVDVRGSLYRRMQKNVNKDSKWYKDLEASLSSLGLLLASIHGCRGDSAGKDCLYRRLEGRWAVKADGKRGRLTFSLPYGGEGRGMTFEHFRIRDGHFTRQKIDIHLPEGRIVMEFFINSCSRG